MIWKYSIWLLPFVALKRAVSLFKWSFVMRIKTFMLSKVWRMSCGRNVVFSGCTIIRSYDKNAIQIRDNVVFNSDPKENLVGLNGATDRKSVV